MAVAKASASDPPLGTGSQVRIFNNTLFRDAGGINTEISTAETPNPYVMLRNNIIVDDAQSPDVTWNGAALCTNAANCDWWNAASGNNITGDAGRPPTGDSNPSDLGPNPRGGGVASATEASLNFVNTTAASENLHIQSGSSAWNAGSNLTGFVFGDIDAVGRSAPWDVGADELPAGRRAAAHRLQRQRGARDRGRCGTRPTPGAAWTTPGLDGGDRARSDAGLPLSTKVATTSPNGTRRAAVVSAEDDPRRPRYLYASVLGRDELGRRARAPRSPTRRPASSSHCGDGVLNVRYFDAAYEQLSGKLLVVVRGQHRRQHRHLHATTAGLERADLFAHAASTGMIGPTDDRITDGTSAGSGSRRGRARTRSPSSGIENQASYTPS